MIVLILKGGVGNQMFQYAYARSVSEKFQLPLELDISKFSVDERDFKLHEFELKYKVKNDKPAKLSRLRKEFNRWNCFLLKKNIRPIGTIYLQGYWQSPKYFGDYESIIKSCFCFKPFVSKQGLKLSESLAISPNSVALHIRRGDYVNNKRHYVCTETYYHRAIVSITKELANPEFFVFSDDITWCRELLRTYSNIHFVEGCSSDIEEMHLMTLCRHNIISNSSFSWWGAWLSKFSDKIVIAPDRWVSEPGLNKKFMMIDKIIPKHWRQMAVD